MATGDIIVLVDNGAGGFNELPAVQASSAEIITGTENSKLVNPKGLKDAEVIPIHVGASAPLDTSILWLDTSYMKLTFDSLTNANALVGDATDVADWNTLFVLPTRGTAFTSVSVSGTAPCEISLYGGATIRLGDSVRAQTSIIKFEDFGGCVTSFMDDSFAMCYGLTTALFPKVTDIDNGVADVFYECTALTSVSLPLLQNARIALFSSCSSLSTISLPSLLTTEYEMFLFCTSLTTVELPKCTNLGGTAGDNSVFFGVTGRTISLTVPVALMTCNGGNPDGDIQYLQANNTVTITTV